MQNVTLTEKDKNQIGVNELSEMTMVAQNFIPRQMLELYMNGL